MFTILLFTCVLVILLGRVATGLTSFTSSAENKMSFNLTAIRPDLLIFSIQNFKSPSPNHQVSFDVESFISYEEAHSFELLHDIFDNMCSRGGVDFRRVIFELDGFTCVGFLHEMFVASIIGSQQFNAELFRVFANYTSEKAREVLFQGRSNAYQHIIAGSLDWRHFPTSQKLSSSVCHASPSIRDRDRDRDRDSGNQSGDEAHDEEGRDLIVGVPSTAVILVLTSNSFGDLFASSSPLHSTTQSKRNTDPATLPEKSLLKKVLEASLLRASVYWSHMNLYVGYDTCLVDTLHVDDMEKHILTIVHAVVPPGRLRGVHVLPHSFDQCRSPLVSQLLIYDKLTQYAFQSQSILNFDTFVLLSDTSVFGVDVTDSSRNFPHIFSDLERTAPDTLIQRKRAPCEVIAALGASCVQSVVAVAHCKSMSHLRVPVGLIGVQGGCLIPPDMRSVMINTTAGGAVHVAREALAALAIYLHDLFRPFVGVTFFISHDDEEVSPGEVGHPPSEPLPPPALAYFHELIKGRDVLLKALQSQSRLPPSSSSSSSSASSLPDPKKLFLMLPSEYHEQELLLQPALIKYGPQDVYYTALCASGACTDAQFLPLLLQSTTPPPGPPPLSTLSNPPAKIAFFTTILGDYETQCPPTASQLGVSVDFICFTNSPQIIKSAGGDPESRWIIDSYPYHLDSDIWSQIDHDSDMYVNSIYDDLTNQDGVAGKEKNYNIVKFYKMNFFLFPRMRQYEYVVWIDGTIEVHSESAALVITNKLEAIRKNGFHVMLFEHTRSGLEYEAKASSRDKRWSTSAHDDLTNTRSGDSHLLVKNNVLHQLQVYRELGYSESAWQKITPNRPLYGMWVTCFIAYDMTDRSTVEFLQSWYTHIQLFSSQCQMSFSFISQKNGIFDKHGVPFRPYSLPDADVHGTNRVNSLFRKKRYHGSSSI